MNRPRTEVQTPQIEDTQRRSQFSDRVLITGGNGQLGTALKTALPNAFVTDRTTLDITNSDSVANFDWSPIEVIINAAAYTDVDAAETTDGRIAAWRTNASAVTRLAGISIQNSLTLVHVSTDYVFDGTNPIHTEEEAFSPLGAYGASKAAGDIVAALVPSHYIFRPSWIIGDGDNFVRTMLQLGEKGVNPTVVSDQIGRPTFTSELLRAITYLLQVNAPFGTYHVSNGGESVSWADIAREVFQTAGLKNTVNDISTEEYYREKKNVASRPPHSTLSLHKLESTGFRPKDWREDLEIYIAQQKQI